MPYSCENCQRTISLDEAFVRSLNFRQAAWCSECWRSRGVAPLIPAQRQAPTEERSPRRWLSRR